MERDENTVTESAPSDTVRSSVSNCKTYVNKQRCKEQGLQNDAKLDIEHRVKVRNADLSH